MRILRRVIDRTGQGYVKLIPEMEEDLWFLYSVLEKGDAVRAKTTRKIVTESNTGFVQTQRRVFTMKLAVQGITYKSEQGEGNLEISGKNCEENAFVAIGKYHTIRIEPRDEITIIKAHWDKMHMKLLKEASDPAESAEVAAILMDEGFGNFFLLKSTMTYFIFNVSKNIPKKRSGMAHAEKALNAFFEECMERFARAVDVSKLRCIILAGPGFTKEAFLKHIMNVSNDRKEFNALKSARDKFIVTTASSPFKQSLDEILSEPRIQNQLKDLRVVQDMKLMDEFLKVINVDEKRAAYGLKEVLMACDMKAIKNLMITDTIFHGKDWNVRKILVGLVDRVKANNGDAHIFFSQHQSGQKLDGFGGVAAILKFQLDLENIPDEKYAHITGGRKREQEEEKKEDEVEPKGEEQKAPEPEIEGDINEVDIDEDARSIVDRVEFEYESFI
eukprot:TRINITY_DN1352_c0_g5_i1.p1 TRINITY_DN1352_c0_g5~~TRINITY_DN1352_c0_g5_i1.p1  ORF type:complete len:445 (+),score=135.42 TRINITY_DN1352_c0_g5_i1:32-1366(+)